MRQRKAPPQQKSPSAYDRRAAYQKASGKNPAFYGYDKVQSQYQKPGYGHGSGATAVLSGSKVYSGNSHSSTVR